MDKFHQRALTKPRRKFFCKRIYVNIIIKYIEMVSNQEDDETPDYQWKIILIGNKRVGKTSISNRYVND